MLRKGLISVVLVAALLLTALSVLLINDTAKPVIADDTTQISPVINLSSKWKYLDNGIDPGSSSDRTRWTKLGYDDSSWKSANGKFGAKSGQLAPLDSAGNFTPTVLLNHYQSDNTCIPTYFFRSTFKIKGEPPTDGLVMVGTISYDDAAIVYINGTRVAAFHEPEGGFETNLSYGGHGATDPVTATFYVDTSLLVAGDNVIAVELHNQRSNSSDVWFSMPSLVMQEYLVMNVGATELERNFNWYFPSANGSVQYAVRNGNSFPAEYTTVNTTAKKLGETYIHRATIKNLQPDTQYVYRIVNDGAVSKNFYFKTAKTDSFSFIYVGDPQVGASWGVLDDAGLWNTTLKTATEVVPNATLLVSAGDQVEVCTRERYYQGLFAPNYMPTLAFANSMGNHENDNYTGVTEYDASPYDNHYNPPNTVMNGEVYGASKAGGDYWYTYNNTLFMHINTNSSNMAEHTAFLNGAISANPNVKWKIAVMHFSMFGAGSYFTADAMAQRRELYAPLFDSLDIDVVLSGHEHIYARSYMIEEGFTPYTAEEFFI